MNKLVYQSTRGFSLIELIVVIVILAILAVIGAQFVVSSTQTYDQTRTRALLVNTSRQALERMSRQLRGALPYSVRVTNAGSCIQFMPIAGGGNYRGAVPDQNNNAASEDFINVSSHVEEFGIARWVSIGALAADEIYGPSAASTERLAGRTVNTLTLISPKSWQRNSLSRRFYLLDDPQAFCLVGSQLRFYPDQDRALTSVDITSEHDLMAENVSAFEPFALTQGSENRNTIVQLNLEFSGGTEAVEFEQQVMIRNVP